MTTPAFLVELKAIGLRDLYHIQGFMRLLMKPRNGMRWTAEDKAEIRLHLKSVAASLPMLAVFTLPGGLLLLPLLAWYLDRRKQRLILSISPDLIKTPAIKATTTTPAGLHPTQPLIKSCPRPTARPNRPEANLPRDGLLRHAAKRRRFGPPAG